MPFLLIPNDNGVIELDLTKVGFEDFRDLIFDHLPRDLDGDEAWYYQHILHINYTPAHHAKLYADLFKSSANLLELYSPAQLESGFWSVMGPSFNGSLSDLIWENSLPIDAKTVLIHSIYDLYAGLFSANPLDLIGNMFWDGLAYNFHPMHSADPNGNPEHQAIREAMFATLSHILQLPSEACRVAALHGLNHVKHPQTQAVISDYISSRTDLSDDHRSYANLCARGEAM